MDDPFVLNLRASRREECVFLEHKREGERERERDVMQTVECELQPSVERGEYDISNSKFVIVTE